MIQARSTNTGFLVRNIPYILDVNHVGKSW